MGKSVNQSTNYRTSQATHQGLLFIVCISVINLWMSERWEFTHGVGDKVWLKMYCTTWRGKGKKQKSVKHWKINCRRGGCIKRVSIYQTCYTTEGKSSLLVEKLLGFFVLCIDHVKVENITDKYCIV